MAAEDGFDTVTAISALESTLSLFSNVLQLASIAFQFVPGMTGVGGVISGVSSGFDNAGKVLDGIDQVRDMCDRVVELYDQHPDPAANPQASGALITKAFTLVQRGNLAEALVVYDDLVGRFGADTDPRVTRLARLAQINTAGVLNKLQRFEETLTRCGEITERYGTDPDRAVVADVLYARLSRMEALAELHRAGEAISCFDEIESICSGFGSGGAQDLEVQIRQAHASALCMKSMILLQQGKPDEALAACDEVTERFGADHRREIQNWVTRSLLARAAVLHHFERWQEEIDAYSTILAAQAKDRSLRDAALAAGYSKVGLLLQLGRFDHAVHACDDFRRAFRSDRAVQVKTAVLRIDGYRGLDQHKKVLKACDKAVDLIGSDPDVVFRQLLAYALLRKAFALQALGRGDEAQSMCEDIDQRFGDDLDPILRQEVARALLQKGNSHVVADQLAAAAVAMGIVVARYGGDADPVLKDLTARARDRIAMLGELGAGSG